MRNVVPRLVDGKVIILFGQPIVLGETSLSMARSVFDGVAEWDTCPDGCHCTMRIPVPEGAYRTRFSRPDYVADLFVLNFHEPVRLDDILTLFPEAVGRRVPHACNGSVFLVFDPLHLHLGLDETETYVQSLAYGDAEYC